MANLFQDLQGFRKRLFWGYTTDRPLQGYVKLYDTDLIKQSLKNYLYTRRGERLGYPTYGTIIWDLLFEPNTERVKQQIIDEVIRAANSEPRVRIISLDVRQIPDGYVASLELENIMTQVADTMTFEFNRENASRRRVQ
jgi:phage baseplate assembly protein W